MKALGILLGLLIVFSTAWAQNAVPAADPISQDQSLELVSKVDPEFPKSEEGRILSAEVELKIEILESGDVSSAQVFSGRPSFGTAAVAAVQQWKFKPFLRDGKPAKISILLPFKFVTPTKGPQIVKTSSTQDSPAKSSQPETGVTSNLENVARIRVSQLIMQAFLTKRTFPGYPAAARQERIHGAVSLKVLIDKDGKVEHIEAISGPKELIDSSIETVWQWKYQPFVLDDKAVAVETIVTINYTIAG